MFIAVAEVVLAELRGRVAERLHDVADAGVLRAEPQLRARQADLCEPGPDRGLARDERGAPGGAALLAVPGEEHPSLFADPVDVRRLVAHVTAGVDDRVGPGDGISHG